MPRIRIFTTAEQALFDLPPVFNSVQRKKFFQITERLESILDTLKTPVNTVGYLLSVGYFRAANTQIQ